MLYVYNPSVVTPFDLSRYVTMLYIYIYTYAYMYIYIYTYTYMYIYVYTALQSLTLTYIYCHFLRVTKHASPVALIAFKRAVSESVNAVPVCMICLEGPKVIALLPCGHKVMMMKMMIYEYISTYTNTFI
jgi:cellulose synthase/poly-beta-1,6-N-acetylglucosamine synthase-like glycosyltransferase